MSEEARIIFVFFWILIIIGLVPFVGIPILAGIAHFALRWQNRPTLAQKMLRVEEEVEMLDKQIRALQ